MRLVDTMIHKLYVSVARCTKRYCSNSDSKRLMLSQHFHMSTHFQPLTPKTYRFDAFTAACRTSQVRPALRRAAGLLQFESLWWGPWGLLRKKKGGGWTCFFKISVHLWEETLGYSALQYHLGQKSLLLEGRFGHFCAVLLRCRPRISFRCRPPLVDNSIFPSSTWGCGMFGMSLLVWEYPSFLAHSVQEFVGSGLVWRCCSSVCMFTNNGFSTGRLSQSHYFRWFAICTWLYHAAFFLVASCSC